MNMKSTHDNPTYPLCDPWKYLLWDPKTAKHTGFKRDWVTISMGSFVSLEIVWQGICTMNMKNTHENSQPISFVTLKNICCESRKRRTIRILVEVVLLFPGVVLWAECIWQTFWTMNLKSGHENQTYEYLLCDPWSYLLWKPKACEIRAMLK